MKQWKVILTVVILLGSLGNQGSAQGYESIFGDSSTSWRFFTKGGEVGGIYQEDADKVSMINNNKYKKIDVNWYLREDTTSGKVWFYNGNKEFLVMNLSLKKNDSFYVKYKDRSYIQPGWQQVDTVFYKNGKKRIHFTPPLSGSYKDTLKFVEGVGPNLGFKIQYHELRYIICVFKDNKNIYIDSVPPITLGDTNFKSCPKIGDWFSSNSQKDNFQKIKIWPNPASSSFHLSVPGFFKRKPGIIQLFNSHGIKKFQQLVDQQRTLIQKPGNSHIYFYRLLNNRKTPIKTGKLIFIE